MRRAKGTRAREGSQRAEGTVSEGRRTHHVTRLLQQVAEGADGAADELFRQVYDELQGMAWKYLRGERKGHTLEVTDLVHEAWLRLSGGLEGRDWKNRAHFYHAAAEAMRRVLVDHARRRGRVKRGGGRRRVTLDLLAMASNDHSEEILALDDAIRRLEEEDGRVGQVVRLRFFAGASVEDTAQALGTSPRTILRDWTFARAWLYRALKDSG